ncbi:MAG: YggS family pyridoxal phosphate-dependent enzyme [Clostridia bacterium]|nr:YggS family pyridoxal phosphate-dependent enzyme [Clostridia bacterium]
MEGFDDLRSRAEMITGEIRDAEIRYGRPEGSVRLVAAAKYALPGEIAFLRDRCGIKDFGENTVRTYLAHAAALGGGVTMDFIGKLQTNKVKYIAATVGTVQSVDSLKLAAEIGKRALAAGRSIPVLIEINSGREPGKSGVMPEEAEELTLACAGVRGIEIAGFMTMGPKYDNITDYFNNFEKTCRLSLDIWQKKLHNITEPVLSMGMSDSILPAIAAGANCVRVGSRLFGRHAPLPPSEAGAGHQV